MRISIRKWGNSYAIRLPKSVVDDLDWQLDAELELDKAGNGITLKRPSKEERLAALLEGVERQEETDWGGPVGREAW